MKVIFSIPALTGEVKTKCHISLTAAHKLLHNAGIEYDEHFVENCPYLPVARATLVAMFENDPEATDQIFVDSDVGFNPEAIVHLLERPEGIVGGVYPLKRDKVGYTAELMTEDGIPLGRDGLIEAKFLPGGFLRIKRDVYTILKEKYPELKYEDSVIEVMGAGIKEAYDFFGMGVYGQKFRTEDYAFCQRWRDIGGTLWVYPDIDFEHVGSKAYQGNLHKYLLSSPGGRDDPNRIKVEEADKIAGFMSMEEMRWLAEHARGKERIVEIGSFAGRSTRAMADNTRGIVHAVDTWNGSAEHLEILSKLPPNTLFDTFTKNTAEVKNIMPLRMDSKQAAELFPDSSVDMVFIDGAHDYESVKSDIEAWLPKLSDSGLICGHDYDWDGVRQAVQEHFSQCSVSQTIWSSTKQGARNGLSEVNVQESRG